MTMEQDGMATQTQTDVTVVNNAERTVVMNRRQLVCGLASGSVVALSGCVENPATGRSQLVLVSDAQLAQLSASAWTQLRQQTPVSRDAALNRRVTNVGQRIVNAVGLTRYNWEYTVFQSDQLNAFVMPGGKVGFYTGILELMETDDKIAVVMGHEVGHVTGRHAAERYSQQVAAGTLQTAAGVALQASDVSFAREAAAILGAGVQFGLLLPYSRKHELEADALGIDYMIRAGYDPRQAVPFWQSMAARSGGRRPPEFMSTHPDPANRIRQIEGMLRQRGY